MSDPTPNEDFSKLQDLLALKRAEQPGPDFEAKFLREFQQRQRGELMRKSSLELLWERIETFLGGSVRSRFALASAATCCAAIALLAAGGLQSVLQKPAQNATPALSQKARSPQSQAPRAHKVSLPVGQPHQGHSTQRPSLRHILIEPRKEGGQHVEL